MKRFKTYLKEASMDIYIPLTSSEIFKKGREGRAEMLLTKIADGDPFLLKGGKTVVIKKDTDPLGELADAIATRNTRALTAFVFKGVDNKNYKITDFLKTPEFGGKGKGSGTRAEDEALVAFKKELAKVFAAEGTPFIYIKIGKRVEKVTEIISTPGTPKADFHMIDPEGKEVFWISHKKGNKANDFQQYGGMAEIKTLDPEIAGFAERVSTHLEDPKTLPPKTAFFSAVKKKAVAMATLFGKEYKASGPSGRQNIDVLFQGPMRLKKVGSKGKIPVYTITSNHTILHGETPKGDYTPVYYVRPEQLKNQFGIRGARFFIVAKLTAQKNRNSKEI